MLDVLRLLREFRFLAERQLRVTVPALTWEVLGELASAGVLVRLDVPQGMGVDGPVFALGREGAMLLRGHDGEDGGAFSHLRPSDKPKSLLFLAHTLARNEFALCLQKKATEDTPGVRLVTWEHAADRIADFVWIEERGHAQRVALVADAYFVLKTPTGEKFFLLEVDRGTVAVKRMALRYRAYAAWWREGGPRRRFGASNLRVLTVAPGERRVEKLRVAACAAHAPKALFLFAEEKDITLDDAGRVLGPVWRATDGGAPRSLLM